MTDVSRADASGCKDEETSITPNRDYAEDSAESPDVEAQLRQAVKFGSDLLTRLRETEQQLETKNQENALLIDRLQEMHNQERSLLAQAHKAEATVRSLTNKMDDQDVLRRKLEEENEALRRELAQTMTKVDFLEDRSSTKKPLSRPDAVGDVHMMCMESEGSDGEQSPNTNASFASATPEVSRRITLTPRSSRRDKDTARSSQPGRTPVKSPILSPEAEEELQDLRSIVNELSYENDRLRQKLMESFHAGSTDVSGVNVSGITGADESPQTQNLAIGHGFTPSSEPPSARADASVHRLSSVRLPPHIPMLDMTKTNGMGGIDTARGSANLLNTLREGGGGGGYGTDSVVQSQKAKRDAIAAVGALGAADGIEKAIEEYHRSEHHAIANSSFNAKMSSPTLKIGTPRSSRRMFDAVVPPPEEDEVLQLVMAAKEALAKLCEKQSAE